MTEQRNIVLREPRTSDPEDLVRMINQPSLYGGMMQLPHSTCEERAAWLTNSPRMRSLVAEVDGQFADHGAVTIHDGRRRHVGNIGIGIDERFQGMGVGRQLLAGLLALADGWLNLRRLELHVYTDNAAGIHIYQEAGFVIEGTHRAFAYRDGQWADAYSMARLREEPALLAAQQGDAHA